MRKEIDEQPVAIRDTLVGRTVRRASRARRAARERRRAARGEQGVRGRVRHRLPLGARREVRDRALDPAAGRDRDRERVPLPRPRAGSRHADARGLASPARRSTRSRQPGTLGARGRRSSRSRTRWGPRSRARPTACSTRTPVPRSASRRRRPSRRRWSPSTSWRSTWRRCAARSSPRRSPRCCRSSTSCLAKVERAIGLDEQVRELAERYRDARDVLFIGRHTGYPAALEGALKLKELSYVHAEGHPGGRAEARPDRADRGRRARRRGRDAVPRLPQDALEHPGGAGARRPRDRGRDRG